MLNKVEKKKCCFYCGVTEDETKIISSSKYSQEPICSKHIQQLKKHGKLFKTSIYDKNEVIYHNNYAEIVIKNKKQEIIKLAKIDLEDVDRVLTYKWGFDGRYVVCRKIGTRLHRFIVGLENGDKSQVDHINHIKEDNRKSNLRVCENKENSRNKSHANNPTGIIGVNEIKYSGRYRARLKLDYKEKHLGSFNKLEDAIKARLEAEHKYFGEYAPQKHLFEEYGIGVD